MSIGMLFKHPVTGTLCLGHISNHKRSQIPKFLQNSQEPRILTLKSLLTSMMTTMMKAMRKSSELFPKFGEKSLRRNSRNESRLNLGGNQPGSEKFVLGLCVRATMDDGSYKLRWYNILPPGPVNMKKDNGGITLIKSLTAVRSLTTQVLKPYPSFLCEYSYQDYPTLWDVVAPNSKIHLIGNENILNIGPQITVGYKGHPAIPPEYKNREAVVLDGKIYVFATTGDQISCQVFDPNTSKWDALPAPNLECLQVRKIISMHVLVYGKKKKILVFLDPLVTCTFDVTTNSWEYGVDIPEQVQSFLGYHTTYSGEAYVILGDFLYMLGRDEFLSYELLAYDLHKKELLNVHGLEGEEFMDSGNDSDYYGGRKVLLVPLGEEGLCLVTSLGNPRTAVGGLLLLCLRFHVQKRDGGLHAVILGRDTYFIQDAFSIYHCVPIKQARLGAAVMS